MNRREFIKTAVDHYSLHFKPRNEDIEKEIRLKCRESDKDINAIVEFANWVDHISFKRAETGSDDILNFNITLCVNAPEFWNDIDRTVFYGGYIMGSAGVIKAIYVSTDGKFYDHKHELIAENEEDYFDYLLTVEFDYHPIIKECVYDALREAGWYEGRSVDVTELDNKFKEVNVFLSQAQLDFLKEFSGLTVKNSEDDYKCRFYSLKKILRDLPRYHTNEKRRRDDCSLDVISSDAADHCYYIQPSGIITFYGLSEGRTTMEGINHVIKNLFCWGFDIDEPTDPHCTFIDVESGAKKAGRLHEYSADQIKLMNREKIVFDDGSELLFNECVSSWEAEYQCIGQKNILGDEPENVPYFVFWIWRGQHFKIVFRGNRFNSPEKLFHKFCDKLHKYGYDGYDIF